MKYFYIFLGIVILIALVYFGFVSNKQSLPKSTPSEEKEEVVSMTNLNFPGVLPDEKIKNKKAVLKTNQGTIEFELYADKSPKTVSNFVYLTENKFYDDLIFHRVVPGFVIQGGDPQGTGMGGPGYKFEDETVFGEYLAGSVAMANSGPNTNGSQFFICLENQPTLPKSYNLFGQVTSGMDVIKKIQKGDKIESVTIIDK